MSDHSHSLAPEEVIRFKVKAELRKRLRGVRKTAPLESCLERSRLIIDRLLAMDVVKEAKSIAVFWPIEARHEVDLRALDAVFRAKNATVAYPSIDPDTNDMQFRVVTDHAHLEERGFGFSEPGAEHPIAKDLDVVIVPALAIDPTGHRIGYGAGYYDRTLPKYAPPAVTIGVAYDYQLVVEVPATEGDVRVDWVVTDLQTIDAKRA